MDDTRSAAEPTQDIGPGERVAAAGDPEARLRILGRLSAFAALYTYALIVFGGIVRITGSGLGCGDDWPRCNGQWIPDFTFETIIEYAHRLLAAGIGVVILGVIAAAFLMRRTPGVSGPGGPLRPLIAAGALLAVQVMLGAVTVWLELPTEVTVAHFVTALLLMAALIAAAVRSGSLGGAAAGAAAPSREARVSARRASLIAVAIGLGVVSLGALTANTPGAPQACRGFPLCNGALMPAPAVAVQIHWTHRLIATLLLVYLAGSAYTAIRQALPQPVRALALLSFALATLQFVVAAVLVTLPLPASMQAAHLAVGAALWFAIVLWAACTLRLPGSSGPGFA